MTREMGNLHEEVSVLKLDVLFSNEMSNAGPIRHFREKA
jgi:hypothetical protein